MAKGIMYVDNIRVEFDDEPTIMDVCRKAGVEMPNFCFHSDLSVYGACRMCVVEDEKTGKIDASCSMEPRDGMRISTNSAADSNGAGSRRFMGLPWADGHCLAWSGRGWVVPASRRGCRFLVNAAHRP